MQKLSSILFCLLLAAPATWAQSAKQMDDSLATLLNKLDVLHAKDRTDYSKENQLENVNDYIIEYIEKVVVRLPITVVDSFPKAKAAGLNIVSSEDTKMRFFSWDRKDEDETKRNLENIAQYMTYYDLRCTDIHSTEDGKTHGYFFSSLLPFKTSEGNVYLAFYQGAERMRSAGVKAFGIKDHVIARVPFFKDRSEPLSELEYDYDSRSEANPKEVPQPHLDKSRKKLYIPIVNDDGIFTKKNAVYLFDGTYFVYDKNEAEEKNDK